MFDLARLPRSALLPALTANRAISPGIADELWRTDGSSSGTFVLTETPARTWDRHSQPQVLDGQVLWTVVDRVGDATLWRSDGSPAGTVPIVTADWHYQSTAPPLMSAGGERVHLSKRQASGRAGDGSRCMPVSW